MNLLKGNCLDTLKTLPDCSVDSIVTDPPYELGFMGKSWDNSGIAYNQDLWAECLRVLKPGGHLLAFSGSRTYHRMAVAIEDAGFEIRDQIMWIYGSGFPKSLDVSKAIEGTLTTGSSNKKDFKNLAGEQVERGNWGIAKAQQTHGQRETNYDETAGETRLGKLAPTTPEAQQWQGWGTALKPAHEPIVVARKPLGSPALDIVQAIEYYLENNVLKGEIKWIQESARPATKKNHQTSSSSTNQQKTVEIFAETVATSGSERLEKETLKSQDSLTKDGKSEIQTSLKSLERSSDCNCGQTSCKHTETSAFAAQNLSSNSSRLTTSKAVEENTEKPQVTFMQKSVRLDSRLTIDSCVGTATLHSEFTVFVLTVICNGKTYELSNNNEGLWTWPSDLPKNLPAQTMTVANNVLTYGTGALNIDGSRVTIAEGDTPSAGKRTATFGTQETVSGGDGSGGWEASYGRWPANVIHDGSDEVLAGFPETAPSRQGKPRGTAKKGLFANSKFNKVGTEHNDEGSAARFFKSAPIDEADTQSFIYCAKASKSERNAGLDPDEFPLRNYTEANKMGGAGDTMLTGSGNPRDSRKQNFHPTVKPLALMRYLIKLVTPPNGIVLDPFLGSGSTAVAAILEGFEWIGCEMTADYFPIIEARIAWAHNQPKKAEEELRGRP